MWTPEDRALVGDYGAGLALTDDQWRLLQPLVPPAKPGGRPRTTDMRRMLDSLFYVLRTGCQWRHLPPSPRSCRGGSGSSGTESAFQQGVPANPLMP